jgi:hypothetical protein
MCELLKWLPAGSSEELRLLERLTALLRSEGSIENVLSLKRIADILASLGNIDFESDVASEFLDLLARRVEGLAAPRPLTARSVGYMLMGLRNLDVSKPSAQRLLRSIIAKIDAFQEPFDSHSIGNAMCVLRIRRDHAGNSAETELCDSLATFLLGKLAAVQGHISPQSLCNIVYSMKTWTGQNKFISEIMSESARRIEDCPDTFDSRQVALSLLGLQKMRGDSVEVRRLLKALTAKLAGCTGEWADMDVVSALTGLRSMRCEDSPEVPLLTGALAAQLARARRSPLSAPTIASAFRGLLGMSSDFQEVRDLVTALQFKIMMSQDTFSPIDFSNIIFGLQSMKSDHSEVRDLLMVVGDKLRSCDGVFSAKDLASIMYGMKGMRSDNEAVRSLLEVITPKISDCSDSFGGREIGSFLYGLQSMSSDALEVRALLKAFVGKVSVSTAALKPQEIGNALYGLRGMRSNHVEVRLLLEQINRLARGVAMPLGAQALSNGLNGLNSMDSSTGGDQLVELLSFLGQQLADCAEDFSIKDLSGAFFGLRGVSCSDDAVRAIVSDLTARLKRCPDPLDPGSLAMIFYGIRSMSNDGSEVPLLLEVLVGKLMNVDKNLSCKDVSAAIFGLQSMKNNSIVVENVLNELCKHLESCPEADFDAQAIMTILYGLQNMNNDSAAVRRVLTALLSKLGGYRGPALSAQEARVAASGLRGMDPASREVRALLDWLRSRSSSAA